MFLIGTKCGQLVDPNWLDITVLPITLYII